MVVDNTQKTSNAIFSTTTKVKEKNTSADEFQATLNEVKNKEEKEDKKQTQANLLTKTLILVLLEKILDLMLGKNERRSIQKMRRLC